MIYDRVKEELLINKKIREDGRYIAIPWPNMPKLSSVIPGIQRSRYIIVTANSKVGKTQIGDFLFLYEPLDFLSSHPDAKLKIKIFSRKLLNLFFDNIEIIFFLRNLNQTRIVRL